MTEILPFTVRIELGASTLGVTSCWRGYEEAWVRLGLPPAQECMQVKLRRVSDSVLGLVEQ